MSDDFVSAVLADIPLVAMPVEPAAFDADLFAQLLQAYNKHRAKYRPLTEFKVTKGQLDELHTAAARLTPIVSAPFPPMPLIFGIPVRLVDTFEESTVYERWRDKYIEELRKKAAGQEPIDFVFDTFGPYLHSAVAELQRQAPEPEVPT